MTNNLLRKLMMNIAPSLLLVAVVACSDPTGPPPTITATAKIWPTLAEISFVHSAGSTVVIAIDSGPRVPLDPILTVYTIRRTGSDQHVTFYASANQQTAIARVVVPGR